MVLALKYITNILLVVVSNSLLSRPKSDTMSISKSQSFKNLQYSFFVVSIWIACSAFYRRHYFYISVYGLFECTASLVSAEIVYRSWQVSMKSGFGAFLNFPPCLNFQSGSSEFSEQKICLLFLWVLTRFAWEYSGRLYVVWWNVIIERLIQSFHKQIE